jgi:hypothetical protein
VAGRSRLFAFGGVRGVNGRAAPCACLWLTGMSDRNRSICSSFWHCYTALQYRHRWPSRASPNSLIPWSMVVTGRQDDDWRRGKCLGVRVSRKGSYSRLERRCLGLYKRLSIINHQPPQRCERGNVIKTAVHRHLRMADREIRFSQQAKHSRVFSHV